MSEALLPPNANEFDITFRTSMERLPVEVALTEQTRKFKAIGRR